MTDQTYLRIEAICEIRAMDEIRKQLEGLDEDSRRRVLDWVNARFGEETR